MNSRHVLPILAGLAILTLISVTIGCGTTPEPATTEQTAAEQPAAAEQEPIFTRDDPGAWEGKESGHLPVIEYKKTDAGLEVTVTVNHVMDANTPHYIMWIKLFDGDGNLLGEKDFQPTDEKAVATFVLSSAPGRLVAQEKCNVHGIWKEEVPVT